MLILIINIYIYRDGNIQVSVVMLVCILNLNRLLKYSIFSGCRFIYCLCTMLHIKFLCRTFNRYPCIYEFTGSKNSIFLLIKGLRFPELSCDVIIYYCRCSIAGICGVWMMFTPRFYSFCIILWVCVVWLHLSSVAGIFYSFHNCIWYCFTLNIQLLIAFWSDFISLKSESGISSTGSSIQ